MADISVKIKLLRAKLGLSQDAFAEQLGVSKSKIQNIETGKQRVDHEFLGALAVNFTVNLNDLIAGDGVDIAAKAVHNTAPEFVPIPRYSVEASAGDGISPEEEARTGFYAFNRKWLERRGLKQESLAVITVRGDSMVPKLSDGDLILVDRSQETVADGIPFVLRVDTDLLVKYVQRAGAGKVSLISENRRYPPREIEISEMGSDIEIVGRVVASMQEW